MTADPLMYVDGPSRYQFVAGNPINYTDPTGLAAGCAGADITENLLAIERDITEEFST